ncbi:MAG: PAS domain S-box protein [Thermodesulfobacteriota bacterium]
MKTVRAHVLALVFVSILPPALLLIAQAHEHSHLARNSVRDAAEKAVRLLGAEHDGIVDGTRQLLEAVGDSLVAGEVSCTPLLRSLREGLPRFAGLLAARPDGGLLCGSGLPGDGPGFSEEPFFRTAVASRTASTGSHGRTEGRRSLPLAVPVTDTAGIVQMVFVAELDLAWMNRQVSSLLLPPGSSFSIFDHRGTVLVHWPEAETWAGRPAEDAPLFTAARGSGLPPSAMRGLDGVERLYAFAALPHGGIGSCYAAVGVPLDAVHEHFDPRRNAAWIALIVTAALGSAWCFGTSRLTRPLGALSAAAERLRDGELGARASAGHAGAELEALVRTFNHMAEALGRRERESRSALESLQASEAALERAQEIARVGSWEWDLKGGEVHGSDQTWRLFGLPSGPRARPVAELLERTRSEDRERVDGAVREALCGKARHDIEYGVVWPDGTRRVLHVRADVLQEEGGIAVRLAGSVQDVTERKRAEEELRRLRHRSELILDSAGEGIFGLDREGRFTFVNQAAAESLGRSAGELAGRDHRGVCPQNRPPGEPCRGARCPIYQALELGESTRQVASIFRRKDGTAFPVELTSGPLGEGGDRAGAVVTFRDVTDRRRAEAALRESHRTLEALFEASPLPTFAVDPAGRVLFWNPAAERVFGWSEGEAVGQYLPIVAPEDREEFDALRRQSLGGRGVAGVEIRRRRKDGARIDLSVSNAPLRDADGAVVGVVAVLEDITRRKAMEGQLRQAQRMEAVGRLAAGVAHDFNNLLTVINGLAELAASDLGPGHTLAPRLRGILDAGERAASLTRQLLAFSRQQVVSPRALDLNAAVGGLQGMLRRLIGEDLELEWKPAAGVWPVRLDPSQLDQLLANLVVNARDAIPGTGTVTVETSNAVLDEAWCDKHPGSTPGEYAVLTVSDTGTGMDQETLAHVFEPFFTTKEPGKGTGLGLATVYGIVTQAGGAVYLESEPGRGTTFRIYLPRWTGGGEAAVVRDVPAVPPRGTETVLLVEDEAAILALGQTILERQGYRVLAARTPGEALLLAEKEAGEIHLLATDVVMPGMNGRELYAKLHDLRPGLKCLYLSGYTADAISRRGVLPEGVSFLQKPYSLKTLAAKVRAVLDDAR